MEEEGVMQWNVDKIISYWQQHLKTLRQRGIDIFQKLAKGQFGGGMHSEWGWMLWTRLYREAGWIPQDPQIMMHQHCPPRQQLCCLVFSILPRSHWLSQVCNKNTLCWALLETVHPVQGRHGSYHHGAYSVGGRRWVKKSIISTWRCLLSLFPALAEQCLEASF